MSRSINESVQLLSQTLDNCKTNLAEKQVADVDNIKISDVDEKIAEIQAGGGVELPFTIKSVKFTGQSISDNGSIDTSYNSREGIDVEVSFEKEDSNAYCIVIIAGYRTCGDFYFTNENTNFKVFVGNLDTEAEYLDFIILGADEDIKQAKKLYSFKVWNDNCS